MELGHFKFTLAKTITAAESEWRPKYGELFERQLLGPCNAVHIGLASSSIIVDPDDFAASDPAGSESWPSPDYQPPPNLLTQLGNLSIDPAKVTHVVITHAHYDHYSGTTRKRPQGDFEPVFPNARYYLGREDWENEPVGGQFPKDTAEVRNTLGLLDERKMLELVSGTRDLENGVQLISCPGESPGHQILKVASKGKTMYCVGDLFHHWIEIIEPAWGAAWTDPKVNLVSRRFLSEMASAENALVIAGHMPPGRLTRRKDRPTEFSWVEDEA